MLLRALWLITLLFGCAPMMATDALSQAQLTDGRVYVQVASHPTIEEAIARASGFAATFADTSVYYTTSGWYAVVIGVAPASEAPALIGSLVAQSRVPYDTLATPGKGYVAQVWPMNTAATADASEVDQARRAEAGWSQSVREGVQNALIWSGDYASKIDGAFGQSTRTAIRSFQARKGDPVTGYLTPAQIASLEQTRREITDLIGFKVVTDYQSGVIVGFPTDLFEVTRFEADGPTSFKMFGSGEPATAGKVMFVSHAYQYGSIQELADLIYRLDFVPANAYRVTKEDWFVVSGEGYDAGLYAYARRFGSEVKGFVLTWPRNEDVIYKPLSVAMFNSLNSVPGITFEAYTSSMQPKPDTSAPVPETVAEPEPSAEGGGSSGTGFFVNSDGYLLTNEHVVEGCARFQYGETPLALIFVDEERDLAILRDPEREPSAPFASFAAAPIKLNADVTAIGFPLQGYIKGLNVTRGAVSGMYGLFGGAEGVQITAPIQPGNSGGPLLDEYGMVVGVVQSKLNALVAAEQVGDLPQNVNFAIRGETAKTYLSQNSIEMTIAIGEAPLRPEQIAELAQSFTVRIDCE